MHYLPTPAGEELRPIVEALGAWGVRWIGHLGDEDLDPSLLSWDMHRNVDHGAVPDGRTVVHFRFPDLPGRSQHWWLVITVDDVDVCDTDPGYQLDLSVTADLRYMTQVWRETSAGQTPYGPSRSRCRAPAPCGGTCPTGSHLRDPPPYRAPQFLPSPPAEDPRLRSPRRADTGSSHR